MRCDNVSRQRDKIVISKATIISGEMLSELMRQVCHDRYPKFNAAIPPRRSVRVLGELSRRILRPIENRAMSTQPELPIMPPMKPAPAAAPAALPPSAAPMPARSGRLRQMISLVSGGSIMLVLVVVFLELIARPGVRPSDLMSMVEARVELGVMNQKMGHAPGEHVLNEAQYQAIIAQAQRSGAAKAEIVFQRDLAAVQADKKRVVGAYTTLYQRVNIIA